MNHQQGLYRAQAIADLPPPSATPMSTQTKVVIGVVAIAALAAVYMKFKG